MAAVGSGDSTAGTPPAARGCGMRYRAFCVRMRRTCWRRQTFGADGGVATHPRPTTGDSPRTPLQRSAAGGGGEGGEASDMATPSPRRRSRSHKLGRVLGAWDLTLLGVGMIVGAGIFAMPGKAVVDTGPALSLAFATAAAAVGVVALSYAELAAAIPTSGAAYAFTFVYFGQFPAWLVGWNLLLEYAVGSSVESRAWSNYFVQLLHDVHLDVPHSLYELTPAGTDAKLDFIAAIMVILVAVIVMWGLKESSLFNSILVLLKLAILLFFCIMALTKFKAENLTPLFPNGPEGMFRGAAMVYFAFLGFDGVSSLAEETVDPQKNVPRGILGSLVIICVTFVSVTFALSGAENWRHIHFVSPLAAVFPEVWAQAIVSFGALIAGPTVILAELIALSRILYCMGRDSLLPQQFAHINGWRGTPLNSIVVSIGGVSLMAFAFDVATLGSLTSIGAAIGFVAVCSCVLKRRYGHQTAAAGRAGVFLGALAGFILLTGCASLSVYNLWAVWLKVVLWTLVLAAVAAACAAHAAYYPRWTLRVLQDVEADPEERRKLLAAGDDGALPAGSAAAAAAVESSGRGATAPGLVTVGGAEAGSAKAGKQVALTPTQRLLGATYLTPLVPAMPLIGIVCTMHMLLGLSLFAYAVYAGWAALGLLVYCTFSVGASSRAVRAAGSTSV